MSEPARKQRRLSPVSSRCALVRARSWDHWSKQPGLHTRNRPPARDCTVSRLNRQLDSALVGPPGLRRELSRAAGADGPAAGRLNRGQNPPGIRDGKSPTIGRMIESSEIQADKFKRNRMAPASAGWGRDRPALPPSNHASMEARMGRSSTQGASDHPGVSESACHPTGRMALGGWVG